MFISITSPYIIVTHLNQKQTQAKQPRRGRLCACHFCVEYWYKFYMNFCRFYDHKVSQKRNYFTELISLAKFSYHNFQTKQSKTLPKPPPQIIYHAYPSQPLLGNHPPRRSQNTDMRVPAYAEIVTRPLALNYAVRTYS